MPGYLKESDAFKKLGIDEIIVYCVNDGAVMSGWSKDLGADKQTFVTLMGDPAALLTKALGMEMTHGGPPSVGIIGRCKRFAILVEDGIIKMVTISEGPDDPAGDNNPSATLAPGLLKALKEL